MLRFICAAVLLWAGAAQASIFVLSLQGQGTVFPALSPTCFEDAPIFPQCLEPYTVPWGGTLTLQTAGDADGAYDTNTGLLGVELQSNLVSVNYDGWAYVRLLSGRVVAVEMIVAFPYGPWELLLSGLSAHYYQNMRVDQDYINRDTIIASAGFAQASPVPEPATYASLLAGICLFLTRFGCRR